MAEKKAGRQRKAAAPRTKPAPAAGPSVPRFKTGTVALIGRPNVGKSTLLNRLLGQKVAIVSDKPQTTRLSILGIKTTDRGQIIFIDNPGIHKPLHKLNKRMMNFVYAALETADLICLLIDATLSFGHGDEFVLETLRRVTKPAFLLINKVDLIRKDKILLMIDRYKDLLPFREIIPISALNGTNLDALEKCLYDNLPAAEKIYGDGDLSDQSERFLLAELVREKVLDHVEMELPFVTAVTIDRVERRTSDADAESLEPVQSELSLDIRRTIRSGLPLQSSFRPEKRFKGKKARQALPLTYVKASIIVERDSHRKIILGRQGRLIKQVGIEARREMEPYLDSRVYLDLQVKVRPHWRDSADVLDLIEGQK